MWKSLTHHTQEISKLAGRESLEYNRDFKIKKCLGKTYFPGRINPTQICDITTTFSHPARKFVLL